MKGKGVLEGREPATAGTARRSTDAERGDRRSSAASATSTVRRPQARASARHRFAPAAAAVAAVRARRRRSRRGRPTARRSPRSARSDRRRGRARRRGLELDLLRDLPRRRTRERYFEMYIAEQQMIAGRGRDAGARRWKPFASTFAAFPPGAYDFIRMAAISRGDDQARAARTPASRSATDGPSQMGLEDLAMLRAVHGSTVLYPCDAQPDGRRSSGPWRTWTGSRTCAPRGRGPRCSTSRARRSPSAARGCAHRAPRATTSRIDRRPGVTRPRGARGRRAAHLSSEGNLGARDRTAPLVRLDRRARHFAGISDRQNRHRRGQTDPRWQIRGGRCSPRSRTRRSGLGLRARRAEDCTHSGKPARAARRSRRDRRRAHRRGGALARPRRRAGQEGLAERRSSQEWMVVPRQGRREPPYQRDTGATEDAASGRAACSCGTDCVASSPPRLRRAAIFVERHERELERVARASSFETTLSPASSIFSRSRVSGIVPAGARVTVARDPHRARSACARSAAADPERLLQKPLPELVPRDRRRGRRARTSGSRPRAGRSTPGEVGADVVDPDRLDPLRRRCR